MVSTLRRRLQVAAIASSVTVAFMGSVIVTPLYTLYEARFGFSPVVLTLVYATYVVGNLLALLFLGQASDQLGRRRVALPALAVAALSAATFLVADGTAWLFAGRFLIGLAVGVLSGTGTAWVTERFSAEDGPTATVTAASANLVGIALGPLVGGLLAEYGPSPLKLPFLIYLGVLAGVAAALQRAPDDHVPTRARWRDLRFRPQVGVPGDRLGSFGALAVTGFVTFAVTGLYFSLIPSIVIRDLHEDHLAVGGLVVSELAAVAVAIMVLGRRLAPRTAMTAGALAIPPAVVLVAAAQAAGSMPLLLTATLFAAVALSLGFRGSLQLVGALAPADRRAEVVSSYFIACFVGNSVPVIGVGVLAAATDRLTATVVFAGLTAALALAALPIARRASGDDREPRPSTSPRS